MGENDVATQPEIRYALARGDWQTVLRAYRSERVRQAVRDFRAQLPRSKATAELDERLHYLYRGRA